MSGRMDIRRRRPTLRASGYVLLETVIATGMLVVGLSVIGAQVQTSAKSIRTMERKMRAMMLAEQYLAELDLGLIALESVDEIEEGDFGPSYPDFGWRLVTEETSIDEMYLLTLDVMHLLRDGAYREDAFEHDDAEVVYTAHAMRVTPRPVNFGTELGLYDDELIKLSEKLADTGIPGLDPDALDTALLGKVDFEELMAVLPLILDAFRIDLSQLSASLPPDILQKIQESGFLGEDGQLQNPNDQSKGNGAEED